MLNIVGVEFQENKKVYYFNSNGFELNQNDEVIVETDRGLRFGKIVGSPKEVSFKSVSKNFNNVIRKATKDDYNVHLKNIEDATKVLNKATKLAKELKLEMRFTDVCYTFDRNQLILYFLSENRVDFRDLAKQLAAVYRTRIELRQIGVRDKAKAVSGIGACGRHLCCALFLNDLDGVGIAMAKNQNLALNPNKINGQCGRLLCCLNYEDDLYAENREGMPEIGDRVKTKSGEGDVISTDILNRRYIVKVNDEKIEVKMTSKCDSCGKCN